MDKTTYNNKKLFLYFLFIFSACMAEESVVCEKTEIVLTDNKKDQDKATEKVEVDTVRKADFDEEEPFDVFSFSDSEIFGVSSASTSVKETGTDSSDNFSKEKRSNFYKDYIEKYYPKAYVIQEKFTKMKCEDLAAAINDIVYVFTKEPWFYFQNKPKGFQLIYFWEYVIDQLAILHDFCINARVDKKTKEIYWPNNKSKYNFWSNFSSSADDENSVSVGDYLKENNVRAYADFYALSFDYHVKMFNEGILIKNVSKANRYMGEIEYILEKLKGTPRESDYTEAAKVCKEIVSILRKKTGSTDYSNFADYMDSSKNGGGYG